MLTLLKRTPALVGNTIVSPCPILLSTFGYIIARIYDMDIFAPAKATCIDIGYFFHSASQGQLDECNNDHVGLDVLAKKNKHTSHALKGCPRQLR